MAERICPFCGKTNSSEAEFCWNCRARLIPLNQPTPPGENATPEQIADWLKQTNKPGETPQPHQPPQEEVPEWLQRVRERSRLEKEAQENAGSVIPNESPEPESESPDWLKEFRDEASQPESPADEEKPETLPPAEEQASAENKGITPPFSPTDQVWISQDENIPDVFPEKQPENEPSVPAETSAKPPQAPEKEKELEKASPETPVSRFAAAYAKPFRTDELRKMFLDSRQKDSAEEESKSAEPEKPEKLQLPDWLKDLEAEVPPEPGEQKPEQQALVEEPAADTSQPDITPNKPPIKSEKAQAAESAAVPPAAPIPSIKSATEPSWAAPSPFEGGSLPDWLKPGQEPAPTPSESTAPAGEEEKVAEGPLEPATLPPWLRSMRPLESAMPENLPVVPQSSEESHGPLAGISNALPGAAPEVSFGKTPAFSGGLKVTDRQRIHAQVLESVLKSTGEIGSVERVTGKDRSKVWKVLVSLLMILALFGKIFFSNISLTPAPAIYPNGVISTRNYLLSLPENSLVLLVADFEPSLSGELKLASQPVMEELMLRKARIAVTSTQPTGDVMAMQMLTASQQKHADYNLASNVVDLGYLAGGGIGLQNFANLPAFSFQNTKPLSSPVLRNGLEWKNISGIIILTDNIENARLWIEQVLPGVKNSPAIMVASAQAAPVLSPYVDSGQIAGLIAGVEGGTMLGQQLNLPGDTASVWDAFQIGILLLVVFIIIGGIIQAIAARKKEANPQEAQPDANR